MMRVTVVVLDSVGVGDAPDAARFETEGSNTLAHTADWTQGVDVPNMEKLGLGKVHPTLKIDSREQAIGCYGAMCEVSNAIDSTSGHWEMMGLPVKEPFPTYPDGFPPEVIRPLEESIGRGILGNKPASGTEIIEELGQKHLDSGDPIVYTSADSVFQVAAHEDVIPVEDLYDICRTARKILTGNHAVGRVIARPFVGSPGNFNRTHRRKDFTLDPPGRTVLDDLNEAGYPVYSVGKINQIFSGQGITQAWKTKDNQEAVERTNTLLEQKHENCFIFTNLVDFDMRYGHRNDPSGYAQALEAWDDRLGNLLETLETDDLLIITADHGTDPTTDSTDHSRELVPLLVYGPGIRQDVDLGVRIGFHDLGQTILDCYNLERRLESQSFLPEITN
ncbi:MAG: phosphopentomutase [bacterium]